MPGRRPPAAAGGHRNMFRSSVQHICQKVLKLKCVSHAGPKLSMRTDSQMVTMVFSCSAAAAAVAAACDGAVHGNNGMKDNGTNVMVN